MMNSNRHVLRATQNRLALQDISTEKSFGPTNKKKLTLVDFSSRDQQENVCNQNQFRPILTATRSIKKLLQTNENDSTMLVSPVPNKTREQLEDDLFVLSEYRSNIFQHLKSIESIYAPKANFMEQQSDINSAMRTILIDWLIEVADEYKVNDETLFLCVQYIDRFLSTVNVTRSKLQLLGTTCMYIASKYEEMYPPALEEFSFITDNTYETKHILRMEQIIMKMLNFTLSAPTCLTFARYYLTFMKNLSTDEDFQCLTKLTEYLSTLTLLHDRPFSSYRSSMIAASCLIYAENLLNKTNENSTNRFVQITSYNEKDLQTILDALKDLYTKTFEQLHTNSSLLRRYFKMQCPERVKQLIHHSKSNDEEELFDVTFDEID